MAANVTKAELKKLLTNLPPGAKLEVSTPEGKQTLILTNEPLTKKEIIERRWPELAGKPISLSEAAKRHNVPRSTVEKWLEKGYIEVLDQDAYPMTVDEADVAYCANIYRERKQAGTGFFGAPLLDDHGLPYQLKRPDVAEYRRQKRTE
jgi:hypothetical protein